MPVVLHTYGMRLRGFSPGCQPITGFYERRDDPQEKYHDLLVYDRALTEKEVRDYELDYLGECYRMKKWNYDTLTGEGYEVLNGQITNVSLNMENHGCLTLDLTIEGAGWGVVYGGYCLGKGYVGADDDFFKGSEKGQEAIMRIMDTVGVAELSKMKGQYVRVAAKGLSDSVKIIGNIVKDRWFDYKTFFSQRDV